MREAIQKSGLAGFSKCIESALPFLEFRIKRILARYNLAEIEARAKALQEIATILGQESDPYIQKEYAKLAASWLKTDADTILTTIKRSQHYSYGGRNSLQRMTEKPGSRIEEAEINLIALAAQSKDKEIQTRFAQLAKALADNAAKIDKELLAAQGKPVDMGGYYHPDFDKVSKSMRPSATFNAALKAI